MPVGSYCFRNGPKGHNIVYNTNPTLWLLTINLEVYFLGISISIGCNLHGGTQLRQKFFKLSYWTWHCGHSFIKSLIIKKSTIRIVWIFTCTGSVDLEIEVVDTDRYVRQL